MALVNTLHASADEAGRFCEVCAYVPRSRTRPSLALRPLLSPVLAPFRQHGFTVLCYLLQGAAATRKLVLRPTICTDDS